MPPSYRRADHVAWRSIAGETVVIDLTGQQLFGLSDLGGKLWHALDTDLGSAELARRCDAEPEATRRFLDALHRADLVECSVGAATPRAPEDEASDGSDVHGPSILWQEPLRGAAQTCAFLPGTTPLCTQAPFS